MQAGGRGVVRPPRGIAFEGDFGHRIDAVLALAMLYGLAGKGEARAIAVSISQANLKAARFVDAIAGFYQGRAVGGAAMIGVPEGPAASDDAAPLVATLSKQAADGAPVYTSNINRLLDTPDNAVLIRNMLLAQHDDNASVVLAGPATGLARVLDLYGSRPQIRAKVKQLVVALGSFSAASVDPSVKGDIIAARKVFAEWPTAIVAVGSEVGEDLRYPAASIEKDFAWAPAHPVADAYRVFKPMPYDAPASALAAMLYAAHADAGYFKLSDPGTISVLDDGRTRFTPGADGKHRHLVVDPGQRERVMGLYASLVSAMPVRGGGRGRGAPPPPAAVAVPPPAAPATAKPPVP
jgi:inosine-uridine nucleoside N-ribohydrolase